MQVTSKLRMAKTLKNKGKHSVLGSAGKENRTPASSLGSSRSTIELHPQIVFGAESPGKSRENQGNLTPLINLVFLKKIGRKHLLGQEWRGLMVLKARA